MSVLESQRRALAGVQMTIRRDEREQQSSSDPRRPSGSDATSSVPVIVFIAWCRGRVGARRAFERLPANSVSQARPIAEKRSCSARAGRGTSGSGRDELRHEARRRTLRSWGCQCFSGGLAQRSAGSSGSGGARRERGVRSAGERRRERCSPRNTRYAARQAAGARNTAPKRSAAPRARASGERPHRDAADDSDGRGNAASAAPVNVLRR